MMFTGSHSPSKTAPSARLPVKAGRAVLRREVPSVFRAVVTIVTTIVLVTLINGSAQAAPRMDVAQAQGRDAPWVVGWNEAVITLDNANLPVWRGEVLVDPTHDRKGTDRPTVRVPVTLAAGEAARLVVPFHLGPGTFPSIILAEGGMPTESGGGEGVPLGLTRPLEGVATIVEVQGSLARGARLIDVPGASSTGPSTAPYPATGGDDDDPGWKLPPGGHGWRTRPSTPPTPGAMPSVGPPSVAMPIVSIAQVARETGDPILPDIAAGWSGAALVVIPSDTLTRLHGRPLDALTQWVLSGGTLAVSVTREEDLRSGTLTSLIGGEARMSSTGGGATSTFAGASLQRGDVSKLGDDGDVARFGIGEVWLLRRDPWARTPDPLAAKTIYALWAHAKDKRSGLVSLPAGNGVRWYDDDRVRKLLDPNAGFRPALGVAAFVVVAYAFLVGPLAFSRARRLGRPLAVLKLTPLLALGLFLILVGLGKVGKGLRGRVRKLSLVEVAGGATRGAATSFHAFYVSDPSAVELAASRPIDTVHLVEPHVEDAPIDIDLGGVSVRNVRSHPWQTVVIGEEAVREIGGHVVLEGTGGRFTLVNKTPYTLEHVTLHPETTLTSPAKSRYFARVKPGETVVAHDGVAVERRVRPMATGYVAPGDENPLKADERAAEAIDALDALIGEWAGTSDPATTSLPVQHAMATALIELPQSKEAGFTVERDVVYLRVIGLGGGRGRGELDADKKPAGKESAL